jgi:hypothetical protein
MDCTLFLGTYMQMHAADVFCCPGCFPLYFSCTVLCCAVQWDVDRDKLPLGDYMRLT